MRVRRIHHSVFPKLINVFICFENKNIGVLYLIVYSNTFHILYHNIKENKSFLAWEKALSYALQFSEHNKLFSNAFQALSISHSQ